MTKYFVDGTEIPETDVTGELKGIGFNRVMKMHETETTRQWHLTITPGIFMFFGVLFFLYLWYS